MYTVFETTHDHIATRIFFFELLLRAIRSMQNGATYISALTRDRKSKSFAKQATHASDNGMLDSEDGSVVFAGLPTFTLKHPQPHHTSSTSPYSLNPTIQPRSRPTYSIPQTYIPDLQPPTRLTPFDLHT